MNGVEKKRRDNYTNGSHSVGLTIWTSSEQKSSRFCSFEVLFKLSSGKKSMLPTTTAFRPLKK